MKRHYFAILSFIAAVFMLTCVLYDARPAAAQQDAAAEKRAGSYAPDELLVKKKKGLKSYNLNAVKGAYEIHENDKSPVVKVKLPPGTDVQAAIGKYKADPNIEYAEPNYLRRPQFIPNDPSVSQQWYLNKVRAKEAWDITTGDNDVIVAVIDTGVDYGHPDLQDKLVSPYNCLTGSSLITGMTDDVGHGTIVAGITAGAINNGIGIAGVGGNIRVMPVKAGDSTGFYDSDIVNGIYWAVDHGARVINMSLGGQDYSNTLEEAVQYAVSNNVVVVASAGNNNSNMPMYPAAFPGVIAVAAAAQEDTRASFSNYGSYIDVSAPGVDIYSTTPRSGTLNYSPDYDFASGTSMASPIVAGLAGLILSVSPALSGTEAANVIFNGAQDLGPQGWDADTGWGRVDAFASLKLTDQVPPTIISADPANHSTEIPVLHSIAASFSEDIFAGPNFSGIILKDESNQSVRFNASIIQNTLKIEPVMPLSFGSAYTLTVPAGAVRDQVYNLLAGDYVTGFSTYTSDLIFEPNDTMEAATGTVPNQMYSGTFTTPGDKDYYRLRAPGIGQVHFYTSLTANTAKDIRVTITNPAGEVAATAGLTGNSQGTQILDVSGGTGDYYIMFESADGSSLNSGEEYSFRVNMQQELGGRLNDTQNLTADFSGGLYKAVISPIEVSGYTGSNPIVLNPDMTGTFSAGLLPAGIYRVSAEHPGNYIAVSKIVYANGMDLSFINIDLRPGDVTGDGTINSADTGAWSAAAGSTVSSPDWNAMADINKDGIVDIKDLVHIAVNFSRQKAESVYDPTPSTGSGGSSGGGPTVLSIQSGAVQPAVGDIITVTVNVSNTTASQGIAAADVVLTYDPEQLELQDSTTDTGVQVTDGAVLGQYANKLIWNDSMPGRIKYGGTRLAAGGNEAFLPVTPYRGNSTLFTAGFKTLRAGSVSLSLDGAASNLFDSMGEKIDYTVPAGIDLNVSMPVVLNSINLDAGSYSLNAGSTRQTVVSAVYSDNHTYDVTRFAGYSSSNPLVARVSQGGLVTGMAEGSTVITAAYGDCSAQATVTVYTPITAAAVTATPDGNKSLALTNSSPSAAIIIPGTVTGATVNMAAVLNPAVSGTVASNALPSLDVSAYTSINTNPVLVAIPAGASLSVPANANWDGTIHLPAVKANDTVTIIPDTGKTASVNTVIEVGCDDVPLTFSKAVRILLPGQAGKYVGYYRAGTFTKITTVMTTDSQAAGDALPGGGDGKTDVGSDLVIWTKHFTRFVTYTQTMEAVPPAGGIVGGGGGGGGAGAPVTPPSDIMASVSSSGGQLSSKDGTVAVTVPEGAIDPGITIKLTAAAVDASTVKADPPEGLRLASGIVEFGPNGKLFNKPVKISLTYNPADVSAQDTAPYYLNEFRSIWELVPGAAVDEAAGTISFETTHFSKYAVMGKPVSKATAKPFDDIAKHWAQADIEYLASKGVVAGKSSGLYDPEGRVTRAEFARMLVGALGLSMEAGQDTFVDVPKSAWYYQWVETAAKAGIIVGSGGRFKPDDKVTRQEMAVMIVNALAVKGRNLTGNPEVLERFEDNSQASGWAKEALGRAVTAKIVNGKSAVKLAPLDNATRAEAAVIIRKCLSLLE